MDCMRRNRELQDDVKGMNSLRAENMKEEMIHS
jgi:hypothetical protein